MRKYDYSELQGLIRAKFGNQENYAKAIGISLTSLSERLANRVPFKQPEIMATKEILNLSPEQVDKLFFTTN